MKQKIFSTKIQIERQEKHLSKNNEWITSYAPWRDLWATVQLKDISVTKALYLFAIKWKGEFPKKFRVKIKDSIFEPTQNISIDFKNNLVIFHANIK